MDFREFGGGSKIVKTFTDTFHRADQPFGLGDQWANTVLLAGGSTTSAPSIPASVNVAGNQASFSLCSTNGANLLMWWPIPLTWNKLFSVPQFSQCRYTADNSGGASFAFNGPAALINTNAGTGYFLQTNTPDGGGTNVVGKYTVVRINGGAATTKIHQNLNFALMDLLRIEAIPTTGGTLVNSYRNGVLQSSDLDSSGNYTFGICGFNDWFISAGITQSIDNFMCGGI